MTIISGLNLPLKNKMKHTLNKINSHPATLFVLLLSSALLVINNAKHPNDGLLVLAGFNLYHVMKESTNFIKRQS